MFVESLENTATFDFIWIKKNNNKSGFKLWLQDEMESGQKKLL